MEFHDLGATCSHHGCRLQDFLPIKCPHCRHTYCKDHAALDAHSCPNATKTVDSNGSPSPSASLPQACAVLNCAEPDQRVFVPCTRCSRSHCLQHRHSDQHPCIIASAVDPQAKAKALLRQHFPTSKPTVAAVPAPPPPKPKPKKKLPILEVMKLKQTAKGLTSIPTQDRSYHRVTLPDGNERPMFFSAAAAVGRALDTAFQATDKSWDATVVSHTIVLVDADTQEPLPTDSVLKNCVQSGVPLVLKLIPK